MYMSDYTLNLAAAAVTERTIQLRAHDASPGDDGTANRIGTASVDVPVTGWSEDAMGLSSLSADVVLGELDPDNNHDVSHVSAWDGANFMGWALMVDDVDAMNPVATPVTVEAGDYFVVSANSLGFRFARA